MRQNKLWVAALIVAVVLLSGPALAACGKKAEEAAEGTTYTCPMHPEVTSDEPGECPTCGMDLVPADELEPASGEMPEHGGM
ncbi:MAG: hypothetical protein GTN49_05795 [candidate division Zixibacteria bacterium]|nr:hypothetical protein [candidate division Zixibacteria bacterium]